MSESPVEKVQEQKEYKSIVLIVFVVVVLCLFLLSDAYYMDLAAKEITELKSQLHSLANQFQSFRDLEEMRHKQIYNLTNHLKRVFLDQ